MRLLAGLGNPGDQYRGSRHNIGFVCVEKVAADLGVATWRAFKGGLLAEGRAGEERILLFKPMQFMNTSGIPLRQVMEYYDIPADQLCVAADDVYVAPGSARIRKTGGDGGHNGWRSVLEHVDPDTFWRVRIGAGTYEQTPAKRRLLPDLEQYVLQTLPPHDAEKTGKLIDKLGPLLVQWLESGDLQEQTLHI
jgi:aminoacyl-tRNA hydrolase